MHTRLPRISRLPWRPVCLALLLTLQAGVSRADVQESTSTAFTVHMAMTVARPATVVYDALTRDVGQWWDRDHTYSGQASNLTMDVRPGGCFCERLPGGGVEHMVVIFADRGAMLRLRGSLGPLQSMAVTGVWTLTLTERNGSTTLDSTYTVSGHSAQGLGALAAPVDQVMTGQLSRLKTFAER